MDRGIRYLAQCFDLETGATLEEIILSDETVSKATSLKELGYLHAEQIDFLKKIQDFKIKQQMELHTPINCLRCDLRVRKQGVFNSKFHGVLTDHKVSMQRVSCSCGWISESSIEGLYGSSMHPDLLEKQAIQGSQDSYEKSSKSLDADSAMKRPINSHSQIFKSVKCVAEQLETIKSSNDYGNQAQNAQELIVNIDGGHIKARGEDRSFEAMIATAHRPENLQYVDKNHNLITSKTIVASAKNDGQETMKLLFKSACRAQGMTKKSNVVCLADGADNCWSIAHSIGRC